MKMHFPKMTKLYQNPFSKNDKVMRIYFPKMKKWWMRIHFPKMTKLYENTFSRNDKVV